jgi:hypothetical protein
MTDFSQGQRKSLAKTGAAMPGGRYPIRNQSDLKNAQQALGISSALSQHIRGALGGK